MVDAPRQRKSQLLKHGRQICVLLRLTHGKAAKSWHLIFMPIPRRQANSVVMKHSLRLRVLVAATFLASSSLSANTAQAAPSLPLPAPQNRTKVEPKVAPKAAPTPKAVTKPAAEAAPPAADDEPYIAPQGTDIPLRRNAPPKVTPQPAPAKAAPTPTPDIPNNSTAAPAGPLPKAGALPSHPEDGTARSGSTTPNTKGASVKGASVGGVRIEGLSDRAALRKLNRVLVPVLRAPVSLSDGQQSWTLRRDQLGATVPLKILIQEARRTRSDVPLRFAVDVDEAARALQTLSPRVNRVVSGRVDAVIPVGGVASRTSQKVTLSVGGSAQRVRQAIEARPSRNSVALVVVLTPVAPEKPIESSTRTASVSPFKDAPYLLAAFSTPYDSSIAGRTTNLRLAARNVNGTVVKPGRIFSTNLAIGRRNAANGWKEAKMFMDGQVVNGVGSGICQCASTVYNAALLAGLPIVERHQHTFRVSYAPASRDATIYWGSKDFRFRNNTPGPIYVRTFLRNDRFHVELYGVQPVTSEVEISSHVLSRKNGTRSEAFRIIKTSAGATTEKLSSDYYRPHP